MRLLDENLPRLSPVSTYPPAIPIFSVVFPDITDELSVFLDNVVSDRCVPNSIPSPYYSDLIIRFSSLPDLSHKHANI